MAVVMEEIDERLRGVELSTQRNTDRIGSHEELCAERYKTINDSIAGINNTLKWAAGGLIVGMLGILVRLVFFQS